MRFSCHGFLYICLQAGLISDSSAWLSPLAHRSRSLQLTTPTPRASELFMSDSSSSATDDAPLPPGVETIQIEKLNDAEFEIIQGIFNKGEENLTATVAEALPTMAAGLIMKLRHDGLDDRKEYLAVSQALKEILDSQFNRARDTLQSLMEAGELRKLDALIGKAARENQLDMPFFQVLNMNLQDAAKEEGVMDNDPFEDAGANRFQILKHIYTRCQEEVEKSVPPGVALLNKVLRTEQSSIRTNQLNHYLCPQPNVIKTPDGKELKLEGREKVLVEHKDFIAAIADAVKQIRTVEKSGGASLQATANMVESCRQVAREARFAIGEHYGEESQELRDFESDLQPVFRPTSPDSPYIQGVSAPE